MLITLAAVVLFVVIARAIRNAPYGCPECGQLLRLDDDPCSPCSTCGSNNNQRKEASK